jgi:hypothetical protein
MPAPAGNSVYQRVESAATELAGLIPALQNETPHKPSHGYTVGGAPQGGHRPLASWNTPAAMLDLEIHAGIRDTEAVLQYQVAGVARPRGGADTVTQAICRHLPALAAGCDTATAQRVARQLETWCWRVRLVLGEREPWQHLPRLPGHTVPRCPWCTYMTLRYKPLSGVVKCVNPACVDEEGRRPAARIDFGPATGEPILTWQDSTSGL